MLYPSELQPRPFIVIRLAAERLAQIVHGEVSGDRFARGMC
jgi:hypothetical protein